MISDLENIEELYEPEKPPESNSSKNGEDPL